jgi:hypothetical protein
LAWYCWFYTTVRPLTGITEVTLGSEITSGRVLNGILLARDNNRRGHKP